MAAAIAASSEYEGDADPAKAAICHCTDCQTLSGSAFRTVVPVSSDSFRMVAGEPTIYVKTGDSGSKRQQGFCPKCGSPIFSTSTDPGPKDLMICVGTIHQRDQFVPKLQFWTRSKQRWVDDFTSARELEKQ